MGDYSVFLPLLQVGHLLSISNFLDVDFPFGTQGHTMATVKKHPSVATYFRKQSNKCKIYTAFLLVDVLILIGVLAFGITRALRRPTKVSVIMPLYIYPDEGAWDPLYNA